MLKIHNRHLNSVNCKLYLPTHTCLSQAKAGRTATWVLKYVCSWIESWGAAPITCVACATGNNNWKLPELSDICIGTLYKRKARLFNWNANWIETHTSKFYRNQMCIAAILTSTHWDHSRQSGVWTVQMGPKGLKGLTNDMPSQRLLVFSMVNAIVFASRRLKSISVKRACWLYARIVVTPCIVSDRCDMTGEFVEFSMRCSSLK